MGVEWYTCDICGNTFPDCGDYTECSNCESYICDYCMEKQEDMYGYTEDEELIEVFGEFSVKECDCCSGRIINDDILLAYLLTRVDIEREELEKQALEWWKEWQKEFK